MISVGKLKKTPGSSSSTADTGTDDASSNFPSQFRFEIPSQDNKKKESVEKKEEKIEKKKDVCNVY